MDTVAMIGRLLVSLAAVLGVMWLLARRARKGMAGRGAKVVEVLDRAPLSKGAAIAVVRVGDQALVLGVAEHGVSLLGDTDLAAVRAARPEKVAKPAAGRRRAGVVRPAVPATAAPVTAAVAAPTAPTGEVPFRPAAAAGAPTTPAGALTGSALSPQTWKQTLEALRDLTARA